MQISKYMLASERDLLWGLTVTTIGYEEIEPGDEYPTHGHADGYYFNLESGRELNEYQLLYIAEGRGTFHSHTVPTAQLREGDLFLLFPGEWHSYSPSPTTGWKSYWIGFKGRNMDDRVRAGFLTPTKPIYHVGFSDDIVHLYKEAYETALCEAAYSQQVLAGLVNHIIGVMYSLERNIELNRNQAHVDMVNRARLEIWNRRSPSSRWHRTLASATRTSESSSRSTQASRLPPTSRTCASSVPRNCSRQRT